MAEAKIAYGYTAGKIPVPLKVDAQGRLFISAGASTILLYDNYSSFPASPSIDDLAYARNGEGLWLVNRKPSGVYRYSGSAWIKGGDLASYFDDGNFGVYNTSDNTKELGFDLSGVTTGNKRVLTVPDRNGTIETKKAQVVNVAISGGDYTSITDALASITDASSTKPYTIWLNSGVYTEAPMTLKPYVTIFGSSEGSAIVKPSNVNSPLFTLVANSSIEELTVDGVTNSSGIYDNSNSDTTSVIEVHFENCSIGFHSVGSTNTRMSSLTFYSTVTLGILNANTTIYTGVIAHNIVSYATTTLESTGGMARIFDFGVYGGNLAIYANGGSVDVHCCDVASCPNVIKTDNGGSVYGFGFDIHYSTGWHIEQLHANDSINVFSNQFNQDQLSIANIANVLLDFNDMKGGDEGLTLYKELHVGAPEKGRESVFGSGDSTNRGIIAYTENTSNVFVDITDEVRSNSGSTFTFTGNLANNRMYFASTLMNGGDFVKFYGIKAAVTTAVTLGGGEIVAEYYNGSAWVEINHMSTMSASPYTRYAEKIFERVQSDQIRFDPTALGLWTKNDPMTLGTNYFWMRLSIKTAVTTAPVFEQFKFHTNRTEINADGFVEYFGDARPLGSLPWAITDNLASSNSPANQDFYLYDDVTANEKNLAMGAVENSLVGTARDRTGKVWKIPSDMDTSAPISVKWHWFGSTDPAANLDVRFTVSAGLRGVGDGIWMVEASAETVEANIRGYNSNNIIQTIGSGQQETIFENETTLDLSEAQTDDVIFLSIGRHGGHAEDTYTGACNLMLFSVDYLRWSNGGFST